MANNKTKKEDKGKKNVRFKDLWYIICNF